MGVSLIPGRGDSGLLSFTLFFGHRLSGCYNIVFNWLEGVWPGQAYIAGWPLVNQETKTNILLLDTLCIDEGWGRERRERIIYWVLAKSRAHKEIYSVIDIL